MFAYDWANSSQAVKGVSFTSPGSGVTMAGGGVNTGAFSNPTAAAFTSAYRAILPGSAIAALSRAATKASFGATTPGWTMRTSVNPFGGHGWNWDTPSSAWLARHFWDHYVYSGDAAFLQGTAWPVMKEICQFWIARLITDANGKLVAPQGWSPEHGPTEDGVSYVQEIVWELFSNTIEAEKVLHNDAAFRDQLIDLRSRLLIPAIGPQGQVTEWANPATEATYGFGTSDHRHTSHLYAAYPGFQFNRVATPAYVAAAKLSLADRGTSGDSRQSWTWPWRTALWARMGEPDKAHDMVRGLLTYNTFGNLFVYANAGTFQIDGSLGMPAAMSEMLVQSHAGEISVLPALPAAWPKGSFTGLRAQGGFEVDAAWQNGMATSLHLRSKAGKTAKLRLPATATSPGAFLRGGDGSVRALTTGSDGTLTFDSTVDGSYAIDTQVNGTTDDDGDGFTTHEEWLAGTNPDRGDSCLQVELVKEGAQWQARWPEIADRKYVLQSSSDLSTWSDVVTHLTTTDAQASQALVPDSPCFYRVQVMQKP